MAWFDNLMTVFSSLILVLSITVVLVNGLFVVSYVKTRSLHTPSNAVLGCLCCSDLLIGVLTLIMSIYGLSLTSSDSVMDSVGDGIPMGKVFFASTGLSSLFMALVNFDRYVAICHPYRYLEYATSRLYTIISLAVSLVYALAISLSFAIDNVYHGYSAAIVVLVIFIATALGFLYCAWKIVMVVHRHRREIASSNGENNCFKRHAKRYRITVFLIIIFAICKLPPIIPFVLITVGTIDVTRLSISAGTFSSLLLLINCILNPFVYYFRITAFRNAVKEVLRCQRPA